MKIPKSKYKVGAEWVTKGQNVDQATNAVSAIGRYNKKLPTDAIVYI